MKNLTKIFMAVAVAMFAFSCVQDTTEDLGLKVEGKKGVTEIALSLEESRTHLGAKAEGQYPLYWSEGDAIAVNGVVSNPLEGIGESANAVFKFNQEVTYPMCVVYPASAAATVEEGETTEPEAPAPVVAYPVHFLAEQPYTVGTFAPQAAPMYGYATEPAEGESSAIQLQHLTGVLRLAIVGNGEKVTSIKVKAEKGKIAGAYTVDCTTGVLTPNAEATNTLTVTCGEGLVLGAEATPVYVAVPAGQYGTFVITIETEANEKMTVKFDSEKKPINAGSVREFSAFTYKANAADSEETFIIDSKEALIEFARIAGTFYPRTKAVVTADIDMTGYDWTPIANFGEYEFDGGDCTISGLNAPLFESCAAYIHDLNLANVNIEITDRLHSGAIACDLYGDIDNCSASGTININNTTFNGTASNSYDALNHGGLVGSLYNHSATNCTNDIDITITSLVAPEKSLKGAVGGVIGGVSGTANECEIDGLINNGDITYVGTTQTANVYMSGIVGKNHDTNGQLDFKVIKNCTNNGNISSTAKSVQTESLIFSGISGRIEISAETVCENLVNNGNLTHNGTCKSLTIGAISSYSNKFSPKNCSNKGTLSIADNAVVTGDTHISGLVAATLTADKLENCSNTGKIYVGSKATAGSKTRIAGLVTGSNSLGTVSGCTNSGDIEIKDATFKSWVMAGGLFVSDDEKYTTIGTITECSNSGNISVASNAVCPTSCHLAGVDGYQLSIKTLMDNVDNSGNITVGDNITFNGQVVIAGIARQITNRGEVKNCNNSGALSIGKCSNVKTGNGGRLLMGGLFYYVGGGTYTDCTNEATGTITAKTGDWASRHILGGWAAYYSFNTTKVTNSTNCENKATVTDIPAEGCAVESCEIGGFTGEPYANEAADENGLQPTLNFTNCKNSGDVIIGGTWSTAQNPMVGGFIGVNNYDCIEMTGCENAGDVIVTAVDCVAPRVGGFTGHDTNNGWWKMTNCVNSGEIKVDGVATGVTNGYTIKLGGFIGIKDSSAKVYFTGCSNTGKVTLGGEQTHKSEKAYNYCVGGFVGYTSNANLIFSNCANGSETDPTKGAVTVGTAPSGVALGGIIGVSTVAITLDGLKNYGPVKMTGAGGQSNTYRVSIGGILGYCAGADFKLLNCENYGHVAYGPTAALGRTDVGGIVGYVAVAATIEGCKNGGKVEHAAVSSSGEQTAAGICGCPAATVKFNDCVNLASAEIIGAGSCGTNYEIGGIAGGPSGSAIEFNRCKNYGAVKYTQPHTSSAYAGGIVGYGYSFYKFDACENHGPVTIAGSTGTSYIGGIVAWARIAADTNTAVSTRIMTNCVNYYDLDFSGTNANGSVHAGGVAGRINDEDAHRHWETISGNKNYGNITFSSNVKTCYYGGIFGTVNVSAKDNKYKVDGKTNVLDNSTPYAIASMTDCVCYGKLKAIGKKASLFTGSAHSASLKFLNSSAGGSIVTVEETKTEVDGSGDEKTTTEEKIVTITADNLKDYLYSTAITADDITTDGITLLTEKPAEATHTH